MILKPRYIEPVFVTEMHVNGFIPKTIKSNGLEFYWHSWVLCEVCCHEGNPMHYIMCTGFHFQDCGLGLAKQVTVTRWNPTYEDHEHKENVDLKSFHYWRPIQVILLKDY